MRYETLPELYRDAYTQVRACEYKGKIGALLRFSNPPFHCIDVQGAQSMHRAVNATLDNDFLIMYGPCDKIHAGGDLKQFGKDDRTLINLGVSIDETLKQQTVVSIYSGTLYGASVQWRSFASHSVAHTGTRIIYPEAELGIVPGWNGIANTLLKAGSHNAQYIMKSAQPLDAQQMLDIGLVDKLVAVHDDKSALDVLIDEALLLVEQPEKKPVAQLPCYQELVRIRVNPENYEHIAGKSMTDPEVQQELGRLGGMPLSPSVISRLDDYLCEFGHLTPGEMMNNFSKLASRQAEMCLRLLQSPDAEEGIQARLEKRVPRFNPI